nr:aminotransferase class V-fold PLP-dependent enzyme [Methanosarcina horonobensis]
MVSPEDLRNAIRDDTILISLMLANNEIGTIQPVEEIGRIAREKRICFHTDAVQAIGHVPIDVKKNEY